MRYYRPRMSVILWLITCIVIRLCRNRMLLTNYTKYFYFPFGHVYPLCVCVCASAYMHIYVYVSASMANLN